MLNMELVRSAQNGSKPGDHYRIAIPLLRFLIKFYCAIGIPLHDYSHLNQTLTFDLIKNIAINAIILYNLFELDIFQAEIFINFINLYKPFFSAVFRLTFIRFSKTVTICNTVYYFVFGHRIVRELDCEPFRAAFRTTAADLRQAIRLATIIAVALSAVFVGANINHFKSILFDNDSAVLLIAQIPVLYTIWMHTFFVGNLSLYQQYATGHAFARIKQKLETRTEVCRITGKRFSKTELRLYLERLHAIIRLNVRLNRLLAFPSIAFVAVYMSNVVNTTCSIISMYAFSDITFFSFLGYPLTSILYLVTIATCNSENCRMFTGICEYMLMISEQSCDSQKQTERKIKVEIGKNQNEGRIKVKTPVKVVTVNDDRNKMRNHSGDLSDSDLIMIREMSPYVEQLRIHLFHFILVDQRFILHSFLAAIGFIVFVVQTNQ